MLLKEAEKNIEITSDKNQFNVFLITLNHKTAPVAVREKFAIPEYKLNEAISSLKSLKSLNSFFILSTCNRTEIYFRAENFTLAYEELMGFFHSFLGVEKKVVQEYSSVLTSNAVIDHAFYLSAGLDSLIAGERQVLSQVKFSYGLCQKEKSLDNFFEKLFQHSIFAAKKIHTITNISKNKQSISSAAIDIVNNLYGLLKEKNVMVLGAGKMSELALERITELGGAKETSVLNRSPHKVIEFSDKYKIDKSFPFENVYEVLNDTDILICTAGAPHFILFANEFERVRKDKNKKLVIIDISLPRNIDPEFGKLENIELVDIDSLQSLYSKFFAVNSEDTDQAKEIILHEKNIFLESLLESPDSLIKDIRNSFEKIRTEKLNTLSKKETFTAEEVDYITKSIVNTLLHIPTTNIKNLKCNDSESLIRTVFGL